MKTTAGYLLQQSTVFVLKVWRVCVRGRLLPVSMGMISELIEDRVQGRVGKDSGEIEKDSFGLGNIRQVRVGGSELTFAAHLFLNSSRKRRHCLLPATFAFICAAAE